MPIKRDRAILNKIKSTRKTENESLREKIVLKREIDR